MGSLCYHAPPAGRQRAAPRRRTTIFPQLFMAVAGLPLALSDGDLITGVLVVVILVISLGIHEAAHAWVANLCGDSTAKDMGRLTLNPVPHIDPVMTILLPGFLVLSGSTIVFGGARPVPVVYQRLRKPARDMMLVAIAGPLSNILIALGLFAVLKLLVYEFDWPLDWERDRVVTVNGDRFFHQTIVDRFGELMAAVPGKSLILPAVLCKSIYYNILLAVFNMIPIPPLDGSRIVAYLLPGSLRTSFQSLDRFGLLLLFPLLFPFSFIPFSGILQGPLRDGIQQVLVFLHTITGSYWI